MKKIALIGTAIAAVLVLSAPAMAETVEIKTGAASVVQTSQNAVVQAGQAAAAANGEIRNNSSVKAIMAATNNTSDIDYDYEANGADAKATTNLGVNVSAELHNNGANAATSGAASVTDNLLGPDTSASNYATSAANWQTGGSLSGSLSYNSSLDLPSMSQVALTAGVQQVSVGPVGQLVGATATSGYVADYSNLGATGVTQNNGSNIKFKVSNQ